LGFDRCSTHGEEVLHVVVLQAVYVFHRPTGAQFSDELPCVAPFQFGRQRRLLTAEFDEKPDSLF